MIQPATATKPSLDLTLAPPAMGDAAGDFALSFASVAAVPGERQAAGGDGKGLPVATLAKGMVAVAVAAVPGMPADDAEPVVKTPPPPPVPLPGMRWDLRAPVKPVTGKAKDADPQLAEDAPSDEPDDTMPTDKPPVTIEALPARLPTTPVEERRVDAVDAGSPAPRDRLAALTTTPPRQPSPAPIPDRLPAAAPRTSQTRDRVDMLRATPNVEDAAIATFGSTRPIRQPGRVAPTEISDTGLRAKPTPSRQPLTASIAREAVPIVDTDISNTVAPSPMPPESAGPRDDADMVATTPLARPLSADVAIGGTTPATPVVAPIALRGPIARGVVPVAIAGTPTDSVDFARFAGTKPVMSAVSGTSEPAAAIARGPIAPPTTTATPPVDTRGSVARPPALAVPSIPSSRVSTLLASNGASVVTPDPRAVPGAIATRVPADVGVASAPIAAPLVVDHSATPAPVMTRASEAVVPAREQPATPVETVVPRAPDPAPAPIRAGTAAQVFAAAIHEAAREDRPRKPVEIATALIGTVSAETQVRAVAATGETASPPLDMQQERWPHAMVDRIERLRDGADAADTRIRLVPDALGAIDVSFRKDGDTVHVHLAAEQAATRTMLSDAQPRLAELAEARGLKLGQTSVDTGGQGQQRTPTPQPQQPARPVPTRPVATEADDTDTRIA